MRTSGTPISRRCHHVVRSLTVILVVAGSSPAFSATLVPTGSVWRYRDDGSNQGTAWRTISFDDSTWASGPAQLGYGDGDEATAVSYGPNASQKYVTTYFRHSFAVGDPSLYTQVNIRLMRDDGAVVYLNGSEVLRSNMPSGAVTSTTLASTALGGADESIFVPASVAPGLLAAGTNVLAVEIHQANGTSSDISFDLELSAATGSGQLTRGPYLQIGTPTSVVVRWRTDVATDSRVRYGNSPINLTSTADVGGLTTEHIVTVGGLNPSTTYYYSVGTTSGPLAGGDADHFFTTAPVAGTATAARVWVLGDSGTANANARAVRDAYEAFSAARPADLWLMLGDNAYTSGTDAEYQAAVFDTYPRELSQLVLWPTIGNHDAASADSATQSGPYYDIFTLPRQAEAGGVPSGTEAYYSFDYGAIHFVCLDSQESDRSPAGAMMTWLDQDLFATDAEWIIAFWHHPPYSKGSHDSDTETQLIEMRQSALPILESHGVDLVLTGHSHSYERSILLDGHYGSSTTLTGSMILDGGDGRVDGNGAYQKSSAGQAPHEGAVYAVAGSSGQVSSGPLNHPVMYVSLLSLGSMVVDVNANVLDAKFIDATGAVGDYFTLVKGAAPTPTLPPSATATAANPTATVTATGTPSFTAPPTNTAAPPTNTAAPPTLTSTITSPTRTLTPTAGKRTPKPTRTPRR